MLVLSGPTINLDTRRIAAHSAAMPIIKHTPLHRQQMKTSTFLVHQSVAELKGEVGQRAYNTTRAEKNPGTSWYYTDDWKKLRSSHRKREPRCRTCGGPGQITDHVIEHRGNRELFFNPTNLQTLCRACHNTKTALARRERDDKAGQSHGQHQPAPSRPVQKKPPGFDVC